MGSSATDESLAQGCSASVCAGPRSGKRTSQVQSEDSRKAFACPVPSTRRGVRWLCLRRAKEALEERAVFTRFTITSSTNVGLVGLHKHHPH